MDHRKLRIGIIGIGFGRVIAQICQALEPDCEVYLSSDDFAATQATADELSAAGAYSNWHDLVKDPKIDLVVVATPNNTHQDMFEEAVKYKKAILLEKPAALTATAIAHMASLVEQYPNPVVVNHAARFHPVVNYLKWLADDGRFGKVLTVRLGSYLNYFSDPQYHGSWYNDKQRGGGQLFGIGTDQIDLARYLLGGAEIASGAVQTSQHNNSRFEIPVDAESQFSAQFLSSDGVSIDISNDTYCFGYRDFIIELVGSAGIALYSDTQGLRVSYSNDQPLQHIKVSDSLPHIKFGNSLLTVSVKYALKELLAGIRNGGTSANFCSMEVARQNLAILEQFRV